MTNTNSYKLAERINNNVNTSVTYKTDLEQYNKPEHWCLPSDFGDCEDYVLLKRALLLEQGWDLDKIHFVCCITEVNEYHGVLLVNTDMGWFVLDNRYDWPMTPKSLPYVWDKGLREDGKWYTISF